MEELLLRLYTTLLARTSPQVRCCQPTVHLSLWARCYSLLCVYRPQTWRVGVWRHWADHPSWKMPLNSAKPSRKELVTSFHHATNFFWNVLCCHWLSSWCKLAQWGSWLYVLSFPCSKNCGTYDTKNDKKCQALINPQWIQLQYSMW